MKFKFKLLKKPLYDKSLDNNFNKVQNTLKSIHHPKQNQRQYEGIS